VAIQHPVFGTVHPDPEVGSWECDAEFTLDGVPIDVSLWPEDDLTVAALDRLARFVTDLPGYDRRARAAIRDDYDSGDEDSPVGYYLAGHPVPGIDALLLRLRLVAIGLHPDDPEETAVFDFAVDPEASQYLLAVKFDAKGRFNTVDLES
jgi:hypothetical protein